MIAKARVCTAIRHKLVVPTALAIALGVKRALRAFRLTNRLSKRPRTEHVGAFLLVPRIPLTFPIRLTAHLIARLGSIESSRLLPSLLLTTGKNGPPVAPPSVDDFTVSRRILLTASASPIDVSTLTAFYLGVICDFASFRVKWSTLLERWWILMVAGFPESP